jgi:predicted permease
LHVATFLGDLRFALRLLWKHRGFTAIATLVLALGIGANSTVFTIVNGLLLKPRVGAPNGQLVSLFNRDTTKPDSYRAFSFATFDQLRGRPDLFASLSAHTLAMVGLREGGATRRLFVDIATKDFFNTFGAPPIKGRGFTADEERPGADVPVVVLSYPLWQRLGGSDAVLGQTITLNNRAFTVVGVAERGFGGPIVMVMPDAFVPTGVYDSLQNDFARDGLTTKLSDPRHFNLFLVAQLRPGATIASVAPALKAVSAQLAIDDPANLKDRETIATPMSRMSISTSPQDDSELMPTSAVLLGMSLVVLFIASFNLANMLLARNGARAKEFAIRMAIGGSRRRMVRQLVTEGFVLSILGGVGGLLLAQTATRWMTAAMAPLMPITVAFDVTPDYRIIGATFLFCMLSTIVFSLGPALRLARTDLVPELKEQAGELGKRSRVAMRDVLVMGQLALSLLMLTVAGLFVRGALEAASVDPGFTFTRGLLINMDASLAGRSHDETRLIYQRVEERLRTVPGVAAAGFGSIMPFGEITEDRSVQKPGPTIEGAKAGGTSMQLGGGSADKNKANLVDAIATTIGTGYFDALGLNVTRGRDFTSSEVFSPTATHVAIVDDVLAAKLFGKENPVGQQVQYKGRQDGDPPIVLDVVGLVPGLRHQLTDAVPVAHIYTPLSQDFRADVYFHVRTFAATPEAEAAMLPILRQALREVDPTLPILRVETRAQYAARNFMLAVFRLGAAIFGVFGGVALLLASIGVYGVKAYIVSRRTREIGIRMALGATPKSVVSLVIREGAVLTAVGLAIGLGLSVLAAVGLRSMLFQVSPFDPLASVGALVFLVAAALAASWIPARRATKVAPITALRG